MRLKWIAGFLALTFMISLAGCGAAADTAEVEVTPTPQPSNEEVVTEEEFYAVYVDVVELLADGLEYEAAMVAEAVEAAVPDSCSLLHPVNWWKKTVRQLLTIPTHRMATSWCAILARATPS